MSTPYQHPDADQLNAFVENALPAHEREQTLAHLATCPHCRAIVALSLPPVEEVLPQPKPVRKPWLSGWRLALPGAIAAPLFTFLLIFTLHNRKSPENLAVVHPQPNPQPIPQAAPQTALEPVQAPPAPALQKHKADAQVPVLSEQSIQNLPLDNRNVATLPTPAPQADAVTGWIGNNPLQTSVVINGRNVDPGPTAPQMALRQTARSIAFAPLPSNLPIASTAANGTRVLAIDTQNALFRSEDAGQHWTAVPAAWTGRALRVDLTTAVRRRTAAPPAPARAAPAEPFAYAERKALGPASLTGTVTDATGATIAGAMVTIGNRTTTANSSGFYTVAGLPAGSYTVVASAPGFQQLTRQVSVTSSPTVADLTLSVGSVSQTVEVSAASDTVGFISTPSVAPALFELTTESGEHWTSPDGQTWTRR